MRSRPSPTGGRIAMTTPSITRSRLTPSGPRCSSCSTCWHPRSGLRSVAHHEASHRSRSLVARHRRRGVLAQQRHEQLDVETFEGIQVATQLRLLRLVLRMQRVRRRKVGRGQRCAGSLERAVDGRDAGAEKLSDLDRSPPQDFPQEQHRALTGRQVLESCDECDSECLPARRQLGGIIGWPCGVAVAERLAPQLLRQPLGVRRGVPTFLSEIHREGPPPSGFEHVQAHVGGDAVQPRPKCRSTFEPVVAPPCPDDRLLDGVLRVELGAQHPGAVSGQLGPVPFDSGCACHAGIICTLGVSHILLRS